MSAKRFRVAFSFAGEKRSYVKEVADILAKRFGEEAILYDNYHKAEFGRARLGRYLPKLYHEESDLVVVVVCKDYPQKEWCGLEWDAIFDLIKMRREEEVALCNFDHATVEGLYSDTGFISLDDETPAQAANLILQRLALNEGCPRDYYLKPVVKPKAASLTAAIPARNPLFTGRERELADIHTKLTGDLFGQASRIVALHGMGGEGKTSTAVEYAYRHAENYDRIFMVRAERIGEFEGQMADLATELGIPEAGVTDEGVKFKAVLRWFDKNVNWLLIIDNAEHLLKLLVKLPRQAQGRILVTTRETVTPRFGSLVEIRCLDDEAGALLLLRCAGMASNQSMANSTSSGPEVDGLDTSEPAFIDARRVSAALGGLALALDHAGTYIVRRGLSPGAYLTLFEKYKIELFENGENPDHETVIVTFTMALEQIESITELGLAAAQLIRMCAFLGSENIPDAIFRARPGLIGSPLAGFVEDDRSWFSIVEVATRFSLIRHEVNPSGFVLHPLVAEVTRQSMNFDYRRRLTGKLIDVFSKWPNTDLYAAKTLLRRLLPSLISISQQIEEQGWSDTSAMQITYWAAKLLQSDTQYELAEHFFRQSLSIARRCSSTSNSLVALSLNNLGLLVRDAGRYEEALTILEEAVVFAEKSQPVFPSALPRCLNSLAGTYHHLRRNDLAEVTWRRALLFATELKERDEFLTVLIMDDLCNALILLEHYEEAESLLLKSQKINVRFRGEKSFSVAETNLRLAVLYTNWKRFEEAEELMATAVSAYEEGFSDKHPDRAYAQSKKADLFYAQGRYAEARDILIEVVRIQEFSLGGDHPYTIQSRSNLKETLDKLN